MARNGFRQQRCTHERSPAEAKAVLGWRTSLLMRRTIDQACRVRACTSPMDRPELTLTRWARRSEARGSFGSDDERPADCTWRHAQPLTAGELAARCAETDRHYSPFTVYLPLTRATGGARRARSGRERVESPEHYGASRR